MTPEQLANEKRKEQAFNSLFETVIKLFPWGKFLGLMKFGAKMLTKNLEKRVCITRDGRPIIVYKSDAGKFIGALSTPSHEYISKYISQQQYGKVALSAIGFGWIIGIKEQNKSICFNISPDEVVAIYNAKKNELAQQVKQSEIEYAKKKLLLVLAIIIIIAIIILLILKVNKKI